MECLPWDLFMRDNNNIGKGTRWTRDRNWLSLVASWKKFLDAQQKKVRVRRFRKRREEQIKSIKDLLRSFHSNRWLIDRTKIYSCWNCETISIIYIIFLNSTLSITLDQFMKYIYLCAICTICLSCLRTSEDLIEEQNRNRMDAYIIYYGIRDYGIRDYRYGRGWL